jgi:DNA-binding FadR family transcriptional regulator
LNDGSTLGASELAIVFRDRIISGELAAGTSLDDPRSLGGDSTSPTTVAAAIRRLVAQGWAVAGATGRPEVASGWVVNRLVAGTLYAGFTLRDGIARIERLGSEQPDYVMLADPAVVLLVTALMRARGWSVSTGQLRSAVSLVSPELASVQRRATELLGDLIETDAIGRSRLCIERIAGAGEPQVDPRIIEAVLATPPGNPIFVNRLAAELNLRRSMVSIQLEALSDLVTFRSRRYFVIGPAKTESADAVAYVADRLLGVILDRELGPLEPLPPPSRLCTTYRVTRDTLASAFELLLAGGWITIWPAGGLCVTDAETLDRLVAQTLYDNLTIYEGVLYRRPLLVDDLVTVELDDLQVALMLELMRARGRRRTRSELAAALGLDNRTTRALLARTRRQPGAVSLIDGGGHLGVRLDLSLLIAKADQYMISARALTINLLTRVVHHQDKPWPMYDVDFDVLLSIARSGPRPVWKTRLLAHYDSSLPLRIRRTRLRATMYERLRPVLGDALVATGDGWRLEGAPDATPAIPSLAAQAARRFVTRRERIARGPYASSGASALSASRSNR